MSIKDTLAVLTADGADFHRFLKGAEGDSVPIDSGSVPTLAGLVKRAQNAIQAAVVVAANSTTAATIGLGEKSFAVPLGTSFAANQWVIITHDADNAMIGLVVGSTADWVTVNITRVIGAGTFSQWQISLTSLPGSDGANGKDGKSNYQIAQLNGFTGTVTEWLASLVGPRGTNGKSAYQQAIDDGFQGTISEWLSSLKGKDGSGIILKGELTDTADLPPDDPLSSAYLIAGDLWIKGESGWMSAGQFMGVEGPRGPAGKSDYDLAVDNGFVGTQADWLASLKGVNGKSAYQLALDAGFVGTLADYQLSLKGADGKDAAGVKLVKLVSKLPWEV
jgi:hypothetical protein